MAPRLLLDEMLPDSIGEVLRAKGHDVLAVVATAELVGLPDEDILIPATGAGRALVTANIRDFMPLDARYRASSRAHAGLVLISSKTFPQNRAYVAAVTSALHSLLDSAKDPLEGRVIFLTRG
jgi:hypothetical protein